jgi:hypothetical protein
VVSQPATVVSRTYFLTRFIPDATLLPAPFCRLYAIDVNRKIVDRLRIAWYRSHAADISRNRAFVDAHTRVYV